MPDKFERQPAEFFRAVNNAYMSRVAAEPDRFALVQAWLPKEEVWKDVHSIIQAWLWLRAKAPPENTELTVTQDAQLKACL